MLMLFFLRMLRLLLILYMSPFLSRLTLIAIHFFPICFLFFFSSRRRHTRYIGDWSSDVCSSDLLSPGPLRLAPQPVRPGLRLLRGLRRAPGGSARRRGFSPGPLGLCGGLHHLRLRSEERRVGKECTSRWEAYNYTRKYK